MLGASTLTSKQAILHEKNRIHTKRKRIFFLVLFILLIVGFFYVIRKPFLRFQNVNVSGNTLVELSDVKSFIDNKIVGYKFFLIPRNSIIFLKKLDLERDVLNKFPRLSVVSITGSKELNVVLSEPIFESMYCSLTGDLSLPTSCALLHSDGKIGSTAPIYSHSPYFTFYKKLDILPEIGSHILGVEEINRISKLSDEISSYNIPVAGFVYGEDYDEVLLDTGGDFASAPRIRILFGATSLDISKTLGIAAKNEGVKKVLLDDLGNLDYVDLRFSEQVVYKKKGEE